jgi:L-methionine (R)-S-oxide reductase
MNTTSKTQIYQNIHTQWSGLKDSQAPWYSNLSNAAALLYRELQPWWVGFYIIEGNNLHLGPFQGPVACTTIPKGKGVCGTAWQNQQSIVVPNVHLFPGHIACSEVSNSEIVVPIYKNGLIWGVLDIDSADFDTFDATDALELEKFCASLTHD